MTTRRSFFVTLLALFGIRKALPMSGIAIARQSRFQAAGLFHPRADLARQFRTGRMSTPVGSPLYIRRPPRFLASTGTWTSPTE